MEQKKLSQGVLFQLAGSALILLSIFLAWFTVSYSKDGSMGASLIQACKLISLEDGAGVVAIIPWFLALACIGNVILLVMKGNKAGSIALAILSVLVCVFAIGFKANEDKQNELSYGIGFILSIIGITLLFIGIALKDEKPNTETTTN